MCNVRHLWKDSPAAERISKDMRKVNGEEWEYSDRRQELVFIGQGLKHEMQFKRSLTNVFLMMRRWQRDPRSGRENLEGEARFWVWDPAFCDKCENPHSSSKYTFENMNN